MVDLNITPYLQEKLKQAQTLQQQLENVISQKYQLDLKIKEIAKTLEELGKIGTDTTVFKYVGSILVSVKDVENLKKELEEEKETLEVRSKTLEKQQKLLEDKYKDIQNEFAKAYGQQQKQEN